MSTLIISSYLGASPVCTVQNIKYLLTDVKEKNRHVKNQNKEDFEIIFHIVLRNRDTVIR